MFIHKINNKKAVIFKLPPLRYSANLPNSFLNGLEYLLELTKQDISLSLITTLRQKSCEKLNLFCHCATMLGMLMNNQPIRGSLSPEECFEINDPYLHAALEANLILQMQSLHHICPKLTEDICIKYIHHFFEYYSNKRLGSKTTLEWLTLASSHLFNMENYILSEAISDYLEELSYYQPGMQAEINDLLNSREYFQVSKNTVFFFFLFRKMLDELGFNSVKTWQPTQSFDEFFHCIKTHGYCLVGGFFGAPFHDKSPVDKDIGKMTVHCFEQGSFQESRKSDIGPQGMMVIGVSKAGYENLKQDLVYFINPADTAQKIFIISYKSFCKRLVATHGYDISNLQKLQLETDQFNYMFYHPALKPNKSYTSTQLGLLCMVVKATKELSAEYVPTIKNRM